DEIDVFEKIKNFNLRPKEVRDELDRYVIKQTEAKKVLSVAVCDHYNHVRRCLNEEDTLKDEYAKQNILVLGPTGVGKTYLLKCIAKTIGVPFIKADATKFSETGYVGRDVEDMVRDLVKIADGNVELAEFGIIYIDEIDKLASSSDSGGKDVNGRGVQINLLKLMEDAEINLKSQTDMMGQMESMMDMMGTSSAKKKKRSSTINTRHILFIVSGAFSRLAEQIHKRLSGTQIGFIGGGPDDTELNDCLQQVETADLVKYGFEPEFIGRLPVRVACEELTSTDLKDILTSSQGSILKQYRNDFAGYDIDFNISDDALSAIATKAAEEKTGARGLMTVLEKIFRHFKFELPSTEIKEFKVDKATVNDPHQTLKAILDANKNSLKIALAKDIYCFAKRFKEQSGFELTFDDSAINTLVKLSLDKDRSIRAICEEKFKDYPYGLKLISQKDNQKVFYINDKAVLNPDKELSQWVVKGFQSEEKKSDDSGK
ncbi:MAG: AAA family ATPase, partial [Lentisphaeraceae bacterium]|nr:AAA family ATPase [Lentisphaeraceae bacterium]